MTRGLYIIQSVLVTFQSLNVNENNQRSLKLVPILIIWINGLLFTSCSIFSIKNTLKIDFIKYKLV